MSAHPFCRLLVFVLLLLASGCAGREHNAAGPSVAYSLDGPPLAIAGEYKGRRLEGSMDRTCMVGIGKLNLQSRGDAEPPMYCEARINSEPSEKGRVRGVLDCTDGLLMLFSLRNLGPDQGVGIAKPEEGGSALMVFFYHSSKEEAERRLPAAMADMDKAVKK